MIMFYNMLKISILWLFVQFFYCQKNMRNFKDSKLIKLISKLPGECEKKLVSFLLSKYHNSNKKVAIFFKAIWKYYPDFSHKSFTAEKIYMKVYPGEDFSLDKFRRLKGDLQNGILHFLAVEELENEEYLREKLTRKGLGRIGYYDAFQVAGETEISAIERRGEIMDLQDILNLHKVNHDLFFHPETDQEGEAAENYVTAGMYYLDCFYALAKTIYGLQLLNRGKVIGKKYKIPLLNQAIKLGKQNILEDNVYFNLYERAVSLLKSEKEDAFEDLKSYLFKHARELSDEGKIMAAAVLCNFAVVKRNNGNTLYQRKLFDLYLFRDEEDIFLHKGSITARLFVNVVITAAICGKFKWATSFMERYLEFVREDIREDALGLSKAFCRFYEKNYGEVLTLLADIQGRNFKTVIRVRSLRVRTYYELSSRDSSYYEMAVNEVKKMRVYLRNNAEKITEEQAQDYANFCKICSMIFNRKPNREAKLKINRMLERLKPLKFKIWLQEKVDALK